LLQGFRRKNSSMLNEAEQQQAGEYNGTHSVWIAKRWIYWPALTFFPDWPTRTTARSETH
jgi:hypothetical protein